MKDSNPVVDVFLWDIFIGRLSWDSRAMCSVFSFSEDYMDAPFDLAPVTDSKEKHRLQSFYGHRGYEGLPVFLADSLPDDWGNLLFDKWTADHRIPLNDMRSLYKLSFIGKRGMGALEFVPEVNMDMPGDQIDLASLYDISLKVLNEREQVRVEEIEKSSLQQLITLGTSAGGKHAKGVIALDESGHARSGQIPLPDNYRYCLLKFKEDPDVPTAEIELAYHEMAMEADIRMTHCELLPISGSNHFLTERFDRLRGGVKLHTQSLRAMSPTANDYMNLFWLCDTLKVPDGQKEELFRRMVFNFVAGISDDHNRNHTFIMDRKGQWSLSPAYDLMFSANTWENPANAAHSLGMWQKRAHVTLEDFVDFGEDIGIPHCRETVRRISQIVLSFPDRCQAAGIEGKWTTLIWDVLKGLIPSEFR